jgi:hypothetical protein
VPGLETRSRYVAFVVDKLANSDSNDCFTLTTSIIRGLYYRQNSGEGIKWKQPHIRILNSRATSYTRFAECRGSQPEDAKLSRYLTVPSCVPKSVSFDLVRNQFSQCLGLCFVGVYRHAGTACCFMFRAKCGR